MRARICDARWVVEDAYVDIRLWIELEMDTDIAALDHNGFGWEWSKRVGMQPAWIKEFQPPPESYIKMFLGAIMASGVTEALKMARGESMIFGLEPHSA
jgi:hypothetical protein